MTSPAFPPAGGRRLFFLHLPKTGGTTLHHHFAQAFAPEEICPERFARLHTLPPEALARYRYFSGHFNYEHLRLVPGPCYVVTVLRDPVERILSTYYFWKRHRPEVVARHNLAGPAAARETDLLGFLRSPSHIVRDAIDNTMARYLAGGADINDGLGYVFSNAGSMVRITEMEIVHRATGNLMAVDLFGFTSHLNEVYAKVSLDFGMPRVQRLERLNTRESEDATLGPPLPEEPLTPEIRTELGRLTMLDGMVYRLARAHWRAQRGR